MIIVYPKNHHETFEKSTFVIGQLPHGYAATINGDHVKTSPSGYFSHFLPLKIGQNAVHIQKFNPNGSTNEHQMTLLRKGHETPLTDLSTPELIEPYLFPTTDYSVIQGQPVTLAVLAPQDSAIICQIQPLGQSLIMLPTDMILNNHTHQFGRPYQSQMPYPEGQWYTAVLDTTGFPTDEPLTLSYVFENSNLTYSQQAKGLLTIWSAPRYAITTEEEVITRTFPNHGSRLTPLVKGTQLQLTAQQDDWYRCRPGNYWVDIANVDIHQSPPSLEPARLDSVHIDVTENGEVAFQLYINQCVPVEVQLGQFQLKLRLPSTISYCDVIRFNRHANECGFEDLSWQQSAVDDFPCAELEFNFVSELLGYHYTYDHENGQLLLKVSTKKGLVRFLQQGNPLVVVVDAGHGGTEKGAMAPDGSAEKDLNLAMATALQDELRNENAIKFYISRETDDNVSLAERTQLAKQVGAHLFLSLHHNALPDGRDPILESGLSTYYYNSFSKPVAHFVQSTLLQHTQLSDYGILYDSLHICRLTQCPSLLLELGFLTNPDDAEKCLDPKHRQQMVNALAITIRRYRLWLLGMTS